MNSKKNTTPKIDKRSLRRSMTEKKILLAVNKLINKKGMEALTINEIARTAGADKVLIYRYFGDLKGLLRRYGETADFWPSIDELLGVNREVFQNKNVEDFATQILINYVHSLRKRPATLKLLSWECTHRNELTIILEETRERSTQNLIAEVIKSGIKFSTENLNVIVLLSAAVNYLAIRGRQVKVFSGMDIASEDGWKQIESAISLIVHSVVGQAKCG